MTLLKKLVYSGIHFACNPSERRSILLSNLISLILFGLGMVLFIAYYLWYGWSVVTMAIPLIAVLSLSALFLNHINLSVVSRVWLSLLIPVVAMILSIYAKRLYYAQQEELDYFTFRFIILVSCVFPPIFFSFRERTLLALTSVAGLLILLAHDPLHAAFNVPYRGHTLKPTNYAFTNVVVFVAYGVMMGGVFFLKWISERSEERTARLMQEMNQSNEELLEKNSEIEAQNQEISAQSENLNVSQKRLQEAYKVIEEQKDKLLKQNQNLSSELVSANRDLTDTNTELIKHNNELRQFSYTVSHNLRGPVASLIGLVSLMNEQQLDAGNREIHDHIRTSVQRLDGIIGDLSKIIDIRHDIFHIRERIDLQQELQEILRGFAKDLEHHQVNLKIDLGEKTDIYSVKPMIHSILFNLISNAIKYRAPTRQPEIAISFTAGDDYVLTVRDNGLGIDLKSHQEDLFKLYKRFHYHTQGKGLGLYLVKLQAEALDGRVDVSSEINCYTTFTVTLPGPGNVDHQVLYQEPHAVISFDARISATVIVWQGPVSSEQYRNVFFKCLEFIKAYNTPNYLFDISQQGFISRDDQQWMFRQILPQAAQYGLRRIAGIRPCTAVDPRIEDYLSDISENLKKLGITQKYFLSFEEATNWIRKENEKIHTP